MLRTEINSRYKLKGFEEEMALKVRSPDSTITILILVRSNETSPSRVETTRRQRSG